MVNSVTIFADIIREPLDGFFSRQLHQSPTFEEIDPILEWPKCSKNVPQILRNVLLPFLRYNQKLFWRSE